MPKEFGAYVYRQSQLDTEKGIGDRSRCADFSGHHSKKLVKNAFSYVHILRVAEDVLLFLLVPVLASDYWAVKTHAGPRTHKPPTTTHTLPHANFIWPNPHPKRVS